MIIKPLSVAQMQVEGKVLLDEHYEELTQHKEIVKLDVDWAKYEMLEKTGVCQAWGAWEEERLIGYVVFFVIPHLHYKSNIFASNDVLFLKKSHRLGMTGIRLIRHAEKELSKNGPVKVVWHVKPETTLEVLLDHFGYTYEESKMSKILGA